MFFSAQNFHNKKRTFIIPMVHSNVMKIMNGGGEELERYGKQKWRWFAYGGGLPP